MSIVKFSVFGTPGVSFQGLLTWSEWASDDHLTLRLISLGQYDMF